MSSATSLVHRWPALLGLVVAGVNLATGASRELAAIVVSVAVLCYLGAAALDRRWVAWAAIPACSVVITICKVTGIPWWVGLGVTALALIVVGLVLRVPRDAFNAQTFALLGYGAAVVVALVVAPRVGFALAGAALAAHAVWDVIHYRRNTVVPRSLAEACLFLDVPLGIGCVVLAIVN